MKSISHHYQLVSEILRLPVAELHFMEALDPVDIRATYRYYTKPHPRYKLIRHKTLGAALLDLNGFGSKDEYLDLIKGKNAGAYHAKRARSRGYQMRQIDRNAHVDAIYAINTSLDERQGRPMDARYSTCSGRTLLGPEPKRPSEGSRSAGMVISVVWVAVLTGQPSRGGRGTGVAGPVSQTAALRRPRVHRHPLGPARGPLPGRPDVALRPARKGTLRAERAFGRRKRCRGPTRREVFVSASFRGRRTTGDNE